MGKKIFTFFLAALTIGILFAGCAKTTAAPAYGTLKVTVYGLDHQPLNGAKVVSDSQPGGQLKVTGLTDPNGMVLFQNIKTGEYDFYISRFDYNQTQMDTTVRCRTNHRSPGLPGCDQSKFHNYHDCCVSDHFFTINRRPGKI